MQVYRVERDMVKVKHDLIDPRSSLKTANTLVLTHPSVCLSLKVQTLLFGFSLLADNVTMTMTRRCGENKQDRGLNILYFYVFERFILACSQLKTSVL